MIYPSYRLVMRSGPTPDVAFDLTEGEMTIGRDISNQIVINDAEISRRHARLIYQVGSFLLEDLGSTNGTFVNSQRLMGPHLLRPGEVVALGQTVSLVFELVQADQAATVVGPVVVPAVERAAPAPVYVQPQNVNPVPIQEQPLPPAPPAIYPASPAQGLVEAQPEVEATPRSAFDTRWLLAGCSVLLIIGCVSVTVFLLWVDSGGADRWCQFFGSLLPACP